MPKENNKMQVDIDTLKKQNVNDLSSIKELYNRIEELGEKITQIKYIDNTLVKKLKKEYEKIKKEYEKLKKIILDENIQIKLTNDIKTINEKLYTMKSDFISFNKNKSFIDNLKNIYLKMQNETYTLISDININSNNVNILGNTSKIVGNYNFIVNNRDVFIENVIFDGLECINFTGSKNVILRNCKIINNTKFGIICSECENVYISNCSFIDNGKNVSFEISSATGFSILANKVKTLKVNNCYFEGTRGQATIRLKEVAYSEIRFNKFNDNFFRAIEYSALDGGVDYDYKGDASHNYIIDCGKRNNNTKWDEGTNGIFGNACLYGVDLIGNTIINSRENGIEGRFRYVRDNYIDGTGVGSRPTTATNGISASCKYIINNVFKNCVGHAITTGDDGKYVNNCSIVGNHFENCGGGILLHFNKAPAFGGLTVANNLNKDGYCIKVINNYTPNSYKDTLGKVTFYNNKGVGLPPNDKVTIEHNNFKLLDHYEKLIKNNNFINRTSNTVDGFYFKGSQTVTTTNSSDYINLNVTGVPYNTSTNSDIQISNIENVILNFRINYKAEHVKILIYETQFDESLKQIYSIEDTNETNDYKLLNYCVRPFSQLTTGKLKLQLITSSNSIDYKEISLNCYNM